MILKISHFRRFWSAYFTFAFLSIPIFFNSCQKRLPANYNIPIDKKCALTTSRKTQNYVFQEQVFEKSKIIIPQNSFSDNATNNHYDFVAIASNECLQNNESRVSNKFLNIKHLDPKLKKQVYRLSIYSLSELNKYTSIIQEDDCIIGVSIDKSYKPAALSDVYNDTRVLHMTHLAAMNVDDAYSNFYEGPYGVQNLPENRKVVIAIIDTGINTQHPDLKDSLWTGPNDINGIDATTINTTETSYDISDISPIYHGTHVAGLTAATSNNSLGIVGTMSSGARIMGVKTFYKDSNNNLVSSSSHIVRAINWAVNSGADVINLSLGGSGDDPLIRDALNDAVDAGVFVVAAAGNADSETSSQELNSSFIIFPAYYGGMISGMLTVGSYDVQTLQKSGFSHYSSSIVEIAAPGANNYNSSTKEYIGLLSTAEGENYWKLSGTSQSAPLVAGAAGLVIGMIRQNYNASPLPHVVEDIIKKGALKNSQLSPYFTDGNQLDINSLYYALSAAFPGVTGVTDDKYADCM